MDRIVVWQGEDFDLEADVAKDFGAERPPSPGIGSPNGRSGSSEGGGIARHLRRTVAQEVWEEVRRRTEKLRAAKPSMTFEAAVAEVVRTDPKLYELMTRSGASRPSAEFQEIVRAEQLHADSKALLVEIAKEAAPDDFLRGLEIAKLVMPEAWREYERDLLRSR
jgi:hypothetical protein